MFARNVVLAAGLSFLFLCLSAENVAADAGCAGSPDGKWVVAGGDNRAVFVLSTENWEIKKKIWIGARIKDVNFTSDGKRCLILGDDKSTRVFSTADWSLERTLDKMAQFVVARNALVGVGLSGSWKQSTLVVWSLEDWKQVREIPIPRKVDQIAISHDGKSVFARSGYYDNAEEKKVDAGPEPKDWGEKSIWKMRKDGKSNDAYLVDLEKGAVVKSITCFDTGGNYRIYPTSTGCTFAKYSQYVGVWNLKDDSYKVVPNGGYAYGSGQADSGVVYSGSLASFMTIQDDGTASKKVSLGKRLPGWPEYFRGFSRAGTDRVVGITDAYRLIVIDTKEELVVKYVNLY